MSIASDMLKFTEDSHKVYITLNGNHEGFPDSWVFRMYLGVIINKKPEMFGLWQLLTDEEIKEVGLDIYRYGGGGIILSKTDKNYYTVYAAVVTIMRMLCVKADIAFFHNKLNFIVL